LAIFCSSLRIAQFKSVVAIYIVFHKHDWFLDRFAFQKKKPTVYS